MQLQTIKKLDWAIKYFLLLLFIVLIGFELLCFYAVLSAPIDPCRLPVPEGAVREACQGHGDVFIILAAIINIPCILAAALASYAFIKKRSYRYWIFGIAVFAAAWLIVSQT